MKKILVIHTNYQQTGGEDIAVQKEISFLRKKYIVEEIIFNNTVESLLNNFIFFLRNKNRKSMMIVDKKINEFLPDYVYVHNTWFKASLGIFSILNKANVQVILKLHNFRYDCTRNYLLKNHLKNNNVCKACGIKKKSFGVFNKYYKDSYIKSLIVIWYGKKYYKILKNFDMKIFVLTKFHKEYLKKLNFRDEKIWVYPNFIESKNIKSTGREYKNQFVYAGRISEEKGLFNLINSFLNLNVNNFKLLLIGEGPDLKKLKEQNIDSRIEFLGSINNKDVLEIIKDSKVVVTATKLYEGQPTLLCEASIHGIPSIYPKTGGIDEFFPKNYNLSFDQFDYQDLSRVLKHAISNDISKIGNENKVYLDEYLNKDRILDIFEKALNG